MLFYIHIITGQFSSLTARIIEDELNADQATLALPDGLAGKTRVPVHLRHKREPLHRQQRIACWYLEDATGLIGSYDQYKVLE